MNGALRMWAWITVLLLSGSARGQATRSVEVPINQAGEVQVAEIVARLAQASGVHWEQPVASLSLSTQGLARSLTKTLLSETLGPEVEIAIQAGKMTLHIDDRILAPDRRRTGCDDFASWPTVRPRPRNGARSTGCVPWLPIGPTIRRGRRSAWFTASTPLPAGSST